jgi:hypothetical protein
MVQYTTGADGAQVGESRHRPESRAGVGGARVPMSLLVQGPPTRPLVPYVEGVWCCRDRRQPLRYERVP